jgi:hypothetical protein
MRSSARIRAAVGHGKNRDSAFDPPQSLLFPFHSPLPSESLNSIKSPTRGIKTFECCCFTVVSVFGFRRFKKSLMRTQKGPPERLIRNLTLYYNQAHDVVHCEPFSSFNLPIMYDA